MPVMLVDDNCDQAATSIVGDKSDTLYFITLIFSTIRYGCLVSSTAGVAFCCLDAVMLKLS